MDNLNYGVIGNCRTAALISETGSIEWLCFPKFDSTSIFAKILDKDTGGEFSLVPEGEYEIKQKYLERTNLLITHYCNDVNCFEIIDFMPRYYMSGEKEYYAPPDVIRYIRLIKGKPTFRVNYKPALVYAQSETEHIIYPDFIKSYSNSGEYNSAYLYTSFNQRDVLDGNIISLKKDEFFLLSYHQKLQEQTIQRAYLKMERTKVYWLNWSDRTTEFPHYQDEILRSALVLKLLSYNPSGAILAAVTTSLPETIGEERNWDYRFCWLRDASMTIKILSALGHSNVAHRYMNYIINLVPVKDEAIQIMYGINGEKKLSEKELDHLAGYEGSKPVRIGNAAYKQKQNDIFGVLVDVIYQLFEMFDVNMSNSEELWTITRSILKVVAKTWREPDRGIWEIRKDNKHFTFSKVLCWVAADRGVKIAKIINMPGYVKEWNELKEEIKADILQYAWNDELQAFTQSYGSYDLDAANLLMESYGFIRADDDKYKATVYATQKHLSRNGLMYRYRNEDDYGRPKSAFTICTFWLITALHRIGERKQAEAMFEDVLGYSNHLGLFSEDMDFDTKRLLGNFPQAYSHLALIETAATLGNGGCLSKKKNTF
ncbi:MAG: glycoside hydrolase family 15 protein [Candidatus Delongbacteria bacterium]|jgi:GH15 family glucan-1,4-alpha-glucosidase|nr:glycoside hydrolase family 15 protein [Candidatus Delongbacteria bacterium]